MEVMLISASQDQALENLRHAGSAFGIADQMSGDLKNLKYAIHHQPLNLARKLTAQGTTNPVDTAITAEALQSSVSIRFAAALPAQTGGFLIGHAQGLGARFGEIGEVTG